MTTLKTSFTTPQNLGVWRKEQYAFSFQSSIQLVKTAGK